MSNRDHPVRRVLDTAAMGEVPREDALDRLKLPAAHRRRVSDEARAIVALRLAGEHGQARRRANEAAGSVIDALPSDQQDSGYLAPPDDEPSDPAALAERVTRW